MKLSSGRKKDFADIDLLVQRCFGCGLMEDSVYKRYSYLYGSSAHMKPNAERAMRRNYIRLRRSSYDLLL